MIAKVHIVSFFIVVTLFQSTLWAQSKPASIKLEIIAKLPEEVDGCSACFAMDNASLKSEKFIAVTNLTDVCFIRIGGKLLKLKEKQEDIYEGEGYTVTIKTKSKHIADELYSERGTIEIHHGNVTKKIAVVGESGC